MAAIYRTLLRRDPRATASTCSTQRIALTPLRKLWIAWKTWVSGRERSRAPRRRRVAVVGAGYAGLAAAVALVRERAARSTLFEANRVAGGRARRVEYRGALLDNGQHLLLGAYRDTLALMREVGVPANGAAPLPAHARAFPAASTLRAPRLPAPLHLAVGARARARALRWRDRWARRALARWRCASARLRVAPGSTVDQLLAAARPAAGAASRCCGGRCAWRRSTRPTSQADAQIFVQRARTTRSSAAAPTPTCWFPPWTSRRCCPTRRSRGWASAAREIVLGHARARRARPRARGLEPLRRGQPARAPSTRWCAPSHRSRSPRWSSGVRARSRPCAAGLRQPRARADRHRLPAVRRAGAPALPDGRARRRPRAVALRPRGALGRARPGRRGDLGHRPAPRARQRRARHRSRTARSSRRSGRCPRPRGPRRSSRSARPSPARPAPSGPPNETAARGLRPRRRLHRKPPIPQRSRARCAAGSAPRASTAIA